MSILNYRQVRQKWQNNFFMYHGVSKVMSHFEKDSQEVVLFENLLSDFSKRKRMDNKYFLIGGVDYDLYDKKIYKKAISLMNVINRPEQTDFEISYENFIVYVELK